MRSFIWKMVKKVFKSEVSREADLAYNSRVREEKRKATLFNYPLGTKVIIRSNEPNDLLIGIVTDYQDFGPDRDILLIVKDESGREFMPLDNCPQYWSVERELALSKLTWSEQWNVMHGYYDIDDKMRRDKEADYTERKDPALTKNV